MVLLVLYSGIPMCIWVDGSREDEGPQIRGEKGDTSYMKHIDVSINSLRRIVE